MLFALTLAAATPFPERVPAMMEACLAAAIQAGNVNDTEDSHKYMCTGEVAKRLWNYLETAKLPVWEQDVPEGRWLSRGFPLGGCFKRVRNPDGTTATDGLSCSIWAPRPLPAVAAPPVPAPMRLAA